MNKEEVIKRIGKRRWSGFVSFMKGQTVGIDMNGDIDYHKADVENFLHKIKTGTLNFWD